MAPVAPSASLPSRAVTTVGVPRRNAFDLGLSLFADFVLTAAVLAVLGAIVLWLAPTFTDDGVEYLHAEPVEALLYGLVALVITTVTAFVLAITIVGLLVVIPGLILLAVLGVGATTVAVIALGSWLRQTVGSAQAPGYGVPLLVGAVAWAAAELVPVAGDLFVFALSTMGYGYLALWVTGRFGRDYGSLAGSNGGGGGGSRDRDDRESRRAVDEGERSDRFRNVAAVDAERDADERDRSNDDATGREGDVTGRDDDAP
ncbi:MAG: hypothetical protein R6U01_10165 [Halorubrum sp.]|uniref:hypothetical protein n=1 Tax=Halorubrum sp. TaxID=1879286 RepID=UPI0039707C37